MEQLELEQVAPRAMDEIFLVWLGIVLGIVFLFFLVMKILEMWHYELSDWRKDNQAGRTMLENLALVSTETLKKEMDSLTAGTYKYSRTLSIQLYMAIFDELKRREKS